LHIIQVQVVAHKSQRLQSTLIILTVENKNKLLNNSDRLPQHYFVVVQGAPSSIKEYAQESGRAVCNVICNISVKYVNINMKDYGTNTVQKLLWQKQVFTLQWSYTMLLTPFPSYLYYMLQYTRKLDESHLC
jgi:predicted transcriptional regulator